MSNRGSVPPLIGGVESRWNGDIEKGSGVPSLYELERVYSTVEAIFDCMDDEALFQLYEGSENDIDYLFHTLVNEVWAAYRTPSKGKISAASFAYLDKFAEEVEESLCLLIFNYFCATRLPDFDMSWHHIEWGNLLQIHKYLCILAARDHSKSWTFSNAHPIWRLYRYKKRTANTELYPFDMHFREGMIITNEFGLAKHHLTNIRDVIEGNDILRDRLHPGRLGWGKEELVCKNGAKLIAKSYLSKMRGYHPQWMVVDDFLNESSLYSQEQRDKYINTFHSVLMNMIAPNGPVAVVGTPFHDLDLYNDLRKKKQWVVLEYPALFPDGSVLYENRYDIKAVLEKRESQGPIIFSREILVKPVTSQSTIFPYKTVSQAFNGMEEYVLVPNRYSHPVDFKAIGVGCDFARSANVGADYSVFITLGVDQLNNLWLINVFRGKGMSYNEQLSQLRRIDSDFNPDCIVMEDNQMQSLFVDGAEEMKLPVRGATTGVNKYHLRSGLPGMSVLFDQYKFKFPRGNDYSKEVTDLISAELASVSWTEKGKLEGVGAHDDTVMALWQAVKACNYSNGLFNFSFM